MSDPSANPQVVVQGLGLIGGSVAAAIRHRDPGCRITGIGRQADRLREAERRGLIDDWATSIEAVDIVPRAVVVVCLPVGLIADAVIAAVHSTDDSVLVTDAGSVKRSIQDAVCRDSDATRRFVGAHPIAGSEQSGFEYSDPNLFEGRPCVVIPSPADPGRVGQCRVFWESLGTDVSLLDVDEHDRLLALTSHLPHVLAVVAAACVDADELHFTGSGFRDTTRVAAGNPEMWSQILRHNRDQVLAAMDRARRKLAELSESLRSGDQAAMDTILRQAAALRRQIT